MSTRAEYVAALEAERRNIEVAIATRLDPANAKRRLKEVDEALAAYADAPGEPEVEVPEKPGPMSRSRRKS